MTLLGNGYVQVTYLHEMYPRYVRKNWDTLHVMVHVIAAKGLYW